MMIWLMQEDMTLEHLGLIPSFLFEDDERPAREQIDERYEWGGWRPMQGWSLDKNSYELSYPGDPPMRPLASTILHDKELILFYRHAWLVILRLSDDSFEIARID